jgi:hypothetical protein
MDMVNGSTAIGAFASRAEAEQAVCALFQAGFRADQVGIVLPDAAVSTAVSEQIEQTALLTGEMFRPLIGAELRKEEVRYYEEAFQEGRPMVIVQSEDRFSEAVDILHRYGGKYMAQF